MSDSATLSAQARQWAQDAQQVVDGWTGTTYSATKDAQLKEVIRRLGILMTTIADHLDRYEFSG